ncbi:unnamed protein product [Closterium sp. Yama58-4]|nr:unnamed protein product [Closterium sp. Yama58-4]
MSSSPFLPSHPPSPAPFSTPAPPTPGDQGAQVPGVRHSDELLSNTRAFPTACIPTPSPSLSPLQATRARRFLVFAYSDEQLSSPPSRTAIPSRCIPPPPSFPPRSPPTPPGHQSESVPGLRLLRRAALQPSLTYSSSLSLRSPPPHPPRPPERATSGKKFLVFAYSDELLSSTALTCPISHCLHAIPPQATSGKKFLVFAYSDELLSSTALTCPISHCLHAIPPQSTSGKKFLVFAYSDEQLSSTRSHLAEAARFAKATNRILVLPKASRSRLSLARALPLCAYFDLSRLDAHWISPDLFLLLARAALTPPFAASAAKAGPSVAFVHLQMQQLWRMPFRSLVDMLSELMVYGMGHAPARRNTIDIAMPANSKAVLHQLHKWRHTDVLVWVKSTFGLVDFEPPTEAISFQMLPYNRAWHAMAHRAMARLPRRYIAVHYRSEFIAFNLGHRLAKVGYKLEADVLEGLMAGCMEAARDLINGMKRRHNISAVFIAADVPFDDKAGSVVRSDSWNETTWRFQGEEKERALAAPREKLRWLREQVTGTVMVDELMPVVNKYDPGIVAILDKLLCAHAHVFLAGSILCGGARSFELDISNHRFYFKQTLHDRWFSNIRLPD